MFWPQIFWGECPPNFWTCIIKCTQIPIRWQSFRAIGRGNSENAWRKKEKTSRAFYKTSRTTVMGGLINSGAYSTIQVDIFRQTTFRPLGVLPLKFLHALETDEGLLAHTSRGPRSPNNGDRGPPKNLIAKIYSLP